MEEVTVNYFCVKLSCRRSFGEDNSKIIHIYIYMCIIFMAYGYNCSWLNLEKFIKIMYVFPSEQIS